MSFLLKDPEAVLDYSVDWGAEYLTGDILATSEWSVIPHEPGGVTVAGSNFDNKISTVKAAGGLAGSVYQLINHVVLASGLTDSRSILLRVEKR
jgi:formate-dependent phosphoribosylglycinamide formyltransferase (GAR transformylase)